MNAMMEPGRWNVGGSLAVGLMLALAAALAGLWVGFDFGWSMFATICASGLFFIAASQAGVTLGWWVLYTRLVPFLNKSPENVRNSEYEPE